MRIAILGDGADERAWFEALAARDGLEVVLADDAEADRRADVLILGGPIADRADILRRAEPDGPTIVCLHPPGPDDLAYLQASGRVVPDLPARLHPAVDRMRGALADGSLGEFRSVVHQVPAPEGDLLDAFARAVDVLRALLGDFETLIASGDPEGPAPTRDLFVRLRSREGKLAELRITRDAEPEAHLTLTGSGGSLRLVYDPAGAPRSHLDRRPDGGAGEDFEWSPRLALLDALGTDAAPTIDDGVRAMELTLAARRSLRLRRTVDVRPAPLSPEAAFKSSMTTFGCLLLLGSVALFAAASAARALGFESAAGAVRVIPLALAGFLLVAWLNRPSGGARLDHDAESTGATAGPDLRR